MYGVIGRYQMLFKTICDEIGPPTLGNLDQAYRRGLYGSQFQKVFPFGEGSLLVDVVPVKDIISHCLFVNSSKKGCFAVSLHRHYRHD